MWVLIEVWFLHATESSEYDVQIIKNADLEELRELGSGTYGTVYHGKWRGTDVAIKRIKKSCFAGRSSEQDRLVGPLNILSNLFALFFLISCIIGVEESQHLRTLPWTISRDIEILINSKILWLLAFVILYMPVLKQGII